MKGIWKIIKRFLPPYKKYLALNILFNILAALLTLFSFAVIIPILKMLFQLDTTVYSYMHFGEGSVQDVIINNFYFYTGSYSEVRSFRDSRPAGCCVGIYDIP